DPKLCRANRSFSDRRQSKIVPDVAQMKLVIFPHQERLRCRLRFHDVAPAVRQRKVQWSNSEATGVEKREEPKPKGSEKDQHARDRAGPLDDADGPAALHGERLTSAAFDGVAGDAGDRIGRPHSGQMPDWLAWRL